MLTVGLRHDVIEILDEHSEPIRTFDRVFGRQAETIFDPATLVALLVIKPGTGSHSPLRAMVSDPVWLGPRPFFLPDTVRDPSGQTAGEASE